MSVPLETQIICIKREIAMRKRVYPKWVREGRMKAHNAEIEIEAMEAVLETVEEVLRVVDEGYLRVTS